MLIHDPRYYIEQIVKQMIINNPFTINSGIASISAIPMVVGAFVEWSNGTGTLYNNSGLWEVKTATGLDYIDGELIYFQYPYFQAGHPLELNEVLTDLGKTKDKKKYPLVYLQEDVIEKENEDKSTLLQGVKIFFLTYTQKTLRSKDRQVQKFEPLLIPLTNLFVKTLEIMGIVYSLETKINRKFWGTQTQYKNEKNILDDPIDGVEITININIEDNKFCNLKKKKL